MQFTLENIQEGQSTIVTLQAESLDAGNSKDFKEKLLPILEGHGTVLIDMGSLNFVDSSGLGVLLSCLRTMNNKDGQLKLFAMSKPVQALFELVRMHRIFAIYNSRDDAVATL